MVIRNPFITPEYFENDPPEIPPDAAPAEPAEPKRLLLKGRDLSFAFGVLCVIHAFKMCQRQGMSIPARALRHGLSPEKTVAAVEAVVELDIELFSMRDFGNANIESQTYLLARFDRALDDTQFDVEELVESFIPQEYDEEAKTRVRNLHVRILSAIADGKVRRDDLLADPGPTRQENDMTQATENQGAPADAPAPSTDGVINLDEVEADVEEAKAPTHEVAPEAKMAATPPATPGEDVFMSKDEQPSQGSTVQPGEGHVPDAAKTPAKGTPVPTGLERTSTGTYMIPSLTSQEGSPVTDGPGGAIAPSSLGMNPLALSAFSNVQKASDSAKALAEILMEQDFKGMVRGATELEKVRATFDKSWCVQEREVYRKMLGQVLAGSASNSAEIQKERARIENLHKQQMEIDRQHQAAKARLAKLEESTAKTSATCTIVKERISALDKQIESADQVLNRGRAESPPRTSSRLVPAVGTDKPKE